MRELQQYPFWLAAWYERHRYDWVFYRRLEKALLKSWLNLQPGDRVCELGCFNGANAWKMSRQYGCMVYGVDIDARVIRLARSFSSTERTQFLLASAESLPFATGSFDKVYGISVLEHFADGQHALREAYRCLKPGGILALTTDSFGLSALWRTTRSIHADKYSVQRYYSRSELTREVEAAGFQLLDAQPILRHWSTGLLFELSVRLMVIKSAASLLLPLLRWVERLYGSNEHGYMQAVCAVKPINNKARLPAMAADGRSRQTLSPKVGVVVLNHNGKTLSERCLQSLADSPYPNKEIIFVDNASTDGSVEYLRERFSELIVVENAENTGVTSGRNCGFREAVRRGADYVLSLDNDTFISPDLIEMLVAVAESNPRIGVVGPKTYFTDAPATIQCSGGHITFTQNVCTQRGFGETDRGQYDTVEDVDYFPGFGFMARREILEQLNFLDEKFYGYGHEDTDFCLRATHLGYRIVYVPKAIMWHHGSATIGGYSAQKKYLEAVNSVYFVRKYATAKDALKYAFFAGFGLVYALIVQSLRGNHKAVWAKARGMWDGLHKPTR